MYGETTARRLEMTTMGTDGPTPLGQDVEILGKLIAELGERVKMLGDKLAPVLPPEPPGCGGLQAAGEIAQPQRCPLSHQLRRLMDDVGGASGRLDELSRRICL
jgi:hypothetical protein